MGRGGERGELKGDKRGGRVGGENKGWRGAGVQGIKPKCEGDGGVRWQCGKKIYWSEKFSYCTANAPPHHPNT
jgi:hypothetical protein